MKDETKVYLDDTGAVVVAADGQQIEISAESAKSIAIRLCSYLNWKIKPSGGDFREGYMAFANGSHTKDGGVV